MSKTLQIRFQYPQSESDWLSSGNWNLRLNFYFYLPIIGVAFAVNGVGDGDGDGDDTVVGLVLLGSEV